MNLRKHNPPVSIKKQIEKLKRDDEFFYNLKAIRNTCDHIWIHDGNDSHYTYSKCTECGETTRT
jgi:hypothetical protein